MNKRVLFLIFGVFLLISCSPLSILLSTEQTESIEPSLPIITATIQPNISSNTETEPTSSPQKSPTPALLPPEDESPLHASFPSDKFPSGQIVGLWVDPQGSLWVSGSQGVYRRDDDGWLALYTSPAGQILGQDDIGRVWVLLDEGNQIAAYRDGNWLLYGPERGWQPAAWGGYLSRGFGDGLVTDDQGRLWLATGGDDLRRLDPTNGLWTRLTARQIGYQPPQEEGYQGHFLTDVVRSDSGKIWIANCIGIGESLAGQGIRRFDGQNWQDTSFTEDDCIFDLEVGARGVVWAGAVDALLQYSPITGSWSRIELPLWGRFQVVVDVTLDEQGRPWVELLRAGGASLDGGAARYYLDGNTWIPVFELSEWQPNTLALAGEGTAWLFLDGMLYYYSSDGLQEVAPVPAQYADLVLDGSGRLWIARMLAADGQLWWYDPPQPEEGS